jgi:tRNA A-37 threonylcarbamoyl transferase component Bud32
MKYILCLVDFYLERFLLFIELTFKKRKYTLTEISFIKSLDTSNISSIWLYFYKKFDSNVQILNIDRKNNLIELKLIKNYRPLFFYRDAEKIKVQLIKMKSLGFIHKDFDFGNLLIKDERLVIVDPGCWIFHNSKFLDKMIEACDKKNILLYKKYKKSLKKEIEYV